MPTASPPLPMSTPLSPPHALVGTVAGTLSSALLGIIVLAVLIAVIGIYALHGAPSKDRAGILHGLADLARALLGKPNS